jgi:hypothetical protein
MNLIVVVGVGDVVDIAYKVPLLRLYSASIKALLRLY